jgi:hypothetical protein
MIARMDRQSFFGLPSKTNSSENKVISVRIVVNPQGVPGPRLPEGRSLSPDSNNTRVDEHGHECECAVDFTDINLYFRLMDI